MGWWGVVRTSCVLFGSLGVWTGFKFRFWGLGGEGRCGNSGQERGGGGREGLTWIQGLGYGFLISYAGCWGI